MEAYTDVIFEAMAQVEKTKALNLPNIRGLWLVARSAGGSNPGKSEWGK